MVNQVNSREEGQEKIVALCKRKAISVEELSELLGLSPNTVRAWYVYPLVKAGRLMRIPNPSQARGKLYKAVGK